MTKQTPNITAKPQRGFTLIEVLVTLVILAIGLLGLASLQSAGMQYNYSAYTRTQATTLAYDIMDRMRANSEAALTGKYAAAIGTMPTTPSSCDGKSANCNGDAMAAHDVYVWKQSLLTLLPQGDGGITRDTSGPSTRFTVTVQWLDNRMTDTADSSTESQIQTIEIEGGL